MLPTPFSMFDRGKSERAIITGGAHSYKSGLKYIIESEVISS